MQRLGMVRVIGLLVFENGKLKAIGPQEIIL